MVILRCGERTDVGTARRLHKSQPPFSMIVILAGAELNAEIERYAAEAAAEPTSSR